MKSGSNPTHTFSKMADDARDLQSNSTVSSDETVCLLLLQALPEDFDIFQQVIEQIKEPLIIDELIDELRAKYDISRRVSSHDRPTPLSLLRIRDE